MITTVAVLVTSSVSGDPVGGLCQVGTSSPASFFGLMLIPLLVYLLLGISFLAAGFISLFKIRNVIKEQGGRAKIDKLEKLMVKIGIFSVLYIVPAGTVIACTIYELAAFKNWELSYICPGCLPRSQLSYPDFSVLMLKYFMSLAVGITSGFWIWSGKTLDAWRHFLGRVCRFSLHKKSGQRGQEPLLGPTGKYLHSSQGPSPPVCSHIFSRIRMTLNINLTDLSCGTLT